tara:strand:+ start:149754 stop:150224 length:471 start_codon:yes stop_codon:yes gene_type:complete
VRHIYIVGDVGNSNGGPLAFHDAETHEEIVLQEAQITLMPGKAPTIDFIHINPGSTEHRAQLVPAPAPLIPKVEDEDEEVCRHTGWVSHDIQGDNRFWCRECDQRFINHPLVAKEAESTLIVKACPHCGLGMDKVCLHCHVIKWKSPDKKKSKPYV